MWAHNVCDQLTKTVFRGLVAVMPSIKEFEPRNYGRMLGVLLRGAVFVFKDAPGQFAKDGLANLSPEQEKKLEKASGMELLYPVVSAHTGKPVSNEDEFSETVATQFEAKAEQLLKEAILVGRYLMNRPVKEQHEFLCGIPEGFALVINDDGEFRGKSRRYEIYLLLLAAWPEISEMQKGHPPKTRRDLLEWLEKQEGRQIVEDQKQFFELCDDIDLDLAPPGHPRKAISE